jgi:hypothetical protein
MYINVCMYLIYVYVYVCVGYDDMYSPGTLRPRLNRRPLTIREGVTAHTEPILCYTVMLNCIVLCYTVICCDIMVPNIYLPPSPLFRYIATAKAKEKRTAETRLADERGRSLTGRWVDNMWIV